MILGIFCAALVLCIALGQSILIALGIGFCLFFGYGLTQGHSFHAMARMAANGIRTVRNILLTFVLIGMLTALWRASGTIAVIICYCSWFIRPAIFLLVTFLLNSLISFLTGTSFGTVATMGVICMTMGKTMQIQPIWVAGAIMSGIFFGDRCSPVSTSALLVSTLTETDIYTNIRQMVRRAAVPFALTCLIYLVLGLWCGHGDSELNLREFFSVEFRLHWICLLPACIIILMSFCKAKVRITMLVSILAAAAVSLWIQQIPPVEFLSILLKGYQAADPQIARLLNGGGILSMVRVSVIVCLSSSYAGIFEGTQLLDGIKEKIAGATAGLPPFAGILGVSVFTSAISCNQTLSIMLTNQLCDSLEPDPQKRAIDLEDAPVLVAPLIPWSIAGAVPIATIGAEATCLLAACYLYLIPLWHLLADSRTFHGGK